VRLTAIFVLSWLGCFPRRTGEAVWAETQEIKFLEYKNIPQFASLKELHDLFSNQLAFE
jgi:hypothetical protein